MAKLYQGMLKLAKIDQTIMVGPKWPEITQKWVKKTGAVTISIGGAVFVRKFWILGCTLNRGVRNQDD